MTKIPPNPNDSQTLITLLTLPLKLEHIYHISSAWRKQANEKHLEKRTLTLPLKLEQLRANHTKTDLKKK